MTDDYADGSGEKLLYHYCGVDAFLSIVKKQELWLSSLNQSNDSMEGKLALQRLQEVLEQKNLNDATIKQVNRAWDNISSKIECCGLCLSNKNDLLSQWRGYASNGAGFAIGFVPTRLRNLEFPREYKLTGSPFWDAIPVLHDVIYDAPAQQQIVRNLVDAMWPHLQAIASEHGNIVTGLLGPLYDDKSRTLARGLISQTMLQWLPQAYTLKGKAFEEESESRLIYVAPLLPRVHEYRTRGHMIVPFVRALMPGDLQSPIAHVMLGPTNPTPERVVESFLRDNNLHHVKVQRSDATYVG
jgi:hypothetical protein